MRSTHQAIRRCIDDFADDLIEFAEQLIREHVENALTRITPPPAPARGRAARAQAATAAAQAEERPGRRKLTAVEKLERAQARKRAREQLALPFSGTADAQEGTKAAPPAAGRRSRRKADGVLPAASQEKPTPPPPPLFVVKRTRDGNIQTLQRKADEDELEVGAGVTAPAAPPA